MLSDTPPESPIVPIVAPPPGQIPSWSQLGLSAELIAQLEPAGFKIPTPVQCSSIPEIYKGRDLIVSAKTGTGKTAAFGLPMIDKLKGREGTYAVVLAPSREIALQTKAVMEQFGAPLGIRSIALIGGISLREDDVALATYPHVIVATPGRLCDHLDRGNIWLEYIEMVVLDEADRMLDMGFSEQLSRVLQDIPKNRQTLLFSATMAEPVERLARKIMQNPLRLGSSERSSPTENVEQHFVFVGEDAKNSELRKLLRKEAGSVFVFTRSKERTSQLWRSLHGAGFHDATHLHSDLRQRDREQALQDFRDGKFRILIATDVIGRGIDVTGVAHVVNFDLPRDPSDYVHRIGRTGRAGLKGVATTFVTPYDGEPLSRIERLLNAKIAPEGYLRRGGGGPKGGQRPRGGGGGGGRSSGPKRRR